MPSLSISWNAVAGAASYTLYRSLVTGAETLYQTNVTSPYLDTRVIAGTTYYYKVTAIGSSGESAKSAEASGTPTSTIPSAPTGLAAVPSGINLSISWNASAGATSYNLYRSLSSGAETLYQTNVTSPYIDTAVIIGTTYYYKVTAVGTGGESSLSSEASATAAIAVAALQDTFVDTNDVTIQAHTPTPDGGFTWAVWSGAGEIQSNKLESVTSGTALKAVADAGHADGTGSISATLPASNEVSAGLLIRADGVSSGYAVVFENDGSQIYVAVYQLQGVG